MITRRTFIKSVAAGGMAMAWGVPWAWAAQEAKIRIGACDWSMGVDGVKAIDTAKAIGLDGIEVSAGGSAAGTDKLTISNAQLCQQYKAAAAKQGLAIASVAMGLLNNFPFATDPRAAGWLDQTITAAKAMGAGVILMAFFGKGDLLTLKNELKKADVEAAVGKIKEAAPKAKEAGVILGIENYLSAEQNLSMLDQIKHDSVRVYYDIGNSTEKGYNVPDEIKQLGDRICQIHFKDGNKFLGEGKVNMKGVGESIAAINYSGWVVLETAKPTKDTEADFKRNAQYTRELLKI